MSKPLHIVILSRYSKQSEALHWGIGQDAKLLEQVLKEANIGSNTRIGAIDHMHPLSFYGARPPKFVDIQIHVEIPCRAAWSWAKINVVVVNPEWWPSSAWNWVLQDKGGADIVIFKSEYARTLFPEVSNARSRVILWRTSPECQTSLSVLSSLSATRPRGRECLYLVGGSENKLRVAKMVCRAWKPTWPTLHVVGNEGVLQQLSLVSKHVQLHAPFQKDEDRIAYQTEFGYHVVLSAAEGFGYTCSEALALGALPLWNTLPVYLEYVGDLLGEVGRVVSTKESGGSYRDGVHSFTEEALCKGFESLLALSSDEETRLRGMLRHRMTVRSKEFRQSWKGLYGSLVTRVRKQTEVALVPPKPLPVADLPHVAVLTLTRNRPRWFANMARNILLADYPPDKLTWVVADDSDSGGRVDGDIMKFQSANPRIHVKYLSIVKPMAVGAKRNYACASAGTEATVFVNMDDDDHYPAGSIHRRVAWLSATKAGCVYCATLPMYDCRQYISAMNVPPLDLAPCERVSEASLAFTRDFWQAGKFPNNVSVAEGEGFLAGREEQTVEIPPDGVIVSFLHGGNAPSRRIPESTEQNGCHYGFDDAYFSYLSGLAV
jgi:hypothetical protein